MNFAGQQLPIEAWVAVVRRLSALPSVNRFDKPGEAQAETIVHALSDIEEAFEELRRQLLPKLVDPNVTGKQLEDVLFETGEVFRHVLYHIYDPEFFRLYRPPNEPGAFGGDLASADSIIRTLGLKPHPEGGHFVETFRDEQVECSTRSASTAIYFLLKQGEISRWHTVDAAEVWHFYAGDPLVVTMKAVDGPRVAHVLGVDLAAGQRPQVVVPAHAWQMAAHDPSTAAVHGYTLVGCTVAPGFEFAGFTLGGPGFEP